MLIDIFVYDTETDAVHRVGDDRHDSLYVVDGVVEYENLQNGYGTLLGGGGTYVFLDSENGSLCRSCAHHTYDFVCKPQCGWCDGYSHFKLTQRKAFLRGAEVANASWVRSSIDCEDFFCSACGGDAWFYDIKGCIARSSYCPNCGAKMDDGGEADEID